MMTNLSKIIFATIAIALLASSTLYSSSPDRPTREEITINQDRQPIEPERSFFMFVEAFYDRSIQLIELTSYGLGEAIAYTLDSHRRVICYQQFDSDSEPVIWLDAPAIPGLYYLVIEASNFYGEGEFEVE